MMKLPFTSGSGAHPEPEVPTKLGSFMGVDTIRKTTSLDYAESAIIFGVDPTQMDLRDSRTAPSAQNISVCEAVHF